VAYTLQPWQVFLAALACWINRHQQAAIDFLREENRVLLEQLGDRRIRLTDDQRRRLAVAGKAVGRKALALFGTPFASTSPTTTWNEITGDSAARSSSPCPPLPRHSGTCAAVNDSVECFAVSVGVVARHQSPGANGCVHTGTRGAAMELLHARRR
jgi:hypothetical protein